MSIKQITLICFLALVLLFTGIDAEAQCAMCKASIESNNAAGNTVGAGLNNGILYILAIPYLIMATVGYLLFKHLKKQKVRS